MHKLVTLLLLCSPLSLLAQEHASATVTLGRRACYEVHLPGCFKTQEGGCIDVGSTDVPTSDLRYYKFAQPTNNSNELLIGALKRQPTLNSPSRSGPVESADHYLITLGRPVRVRHATEAEWQHSPQLPLFIRRYDPGHRELDHFDTRVPDFRHQQYIYAGKRFDKSGLYWPSQLGISSRSGDDRYLTVHSWDGRGGGPEGWDLTPLFNLSGRYWVDLYEVSSGRKLIAISGKTHDGSGDGMVGGAQWFGLPYFVFPLRTDLTRLLICDLDQLTGSKR